MAKKANADGIKFLTVTDLHYCKKDDLIGRRHCLSAEKLKRIIDEHSDGCDFIVDLGDTADGFEGSGNQETLMEEIAEILKNSGLPYYCAIGNHDTSLPKNKIEKILNMTELPDIHLTDGKKKVIPVRSH